MPPLLLSASAALAALLLLVRYKITDDVLLISRAFIYAGISATYTYIELSSHIVYGEGDMSRAILRVLLFVLISHEIATFAVRLRHYRRSGIYVN